MPIPLRSDFDAQKTRAAARRSRDGPQARRLLALAAIYDGAARTEAARVRISRDGERGFQRIVSSDFAGS